MSTGTVKWYDPEKGFGFIARDEGGEDIFVHRSAVGYETLNEGDRVEFTEGMGQRGPSAQSISVLERNTSVAPRKSNDRYASDADTESLPVVTGTVKRYDAVKGFGFISPDAGGPDVFVHRSACGDSGLYEGDRVEFRLGSGAKGPRAERVQVLDDSRSGSSY